MIAKITIGAGFGGSLDYDRDKDAKNSKEVTLLAAEGVDMNYDADGKMEPDYKAIARSFRMQADLNPRVKRPVVHIALSFHPKDAPRLTDEYMVRIAKEYMERMGFTDTQYIIHRHAETNNPHMHIILNRVNKHGERISDKYELKRSTTLCREITLREGLTWGQSQKQEQSADKDLGFAAMMREGEKSGADGSFSLVEPESEDRKTGRSTAGELLEMGMEAGISILGSGGEGAKKDEQEIGKKRGRGMGM